ARRELLRGRDARRAALHYEGTLPLIEILRTANDRRHVGDRPGEQARQTRRGGVGQIDAEGAAEVREQRRARLRIFRSELPARRAFECAGSAIHGEIGLAERCVVRGRRRQEDLIVGNRIASEITRQTGGRHRARRRNRGATARALGAGVAGERAKTEAQNCDATSVHARLPRKPAAVRNCRRSGAPSARHGRTPAGLHRGSRHRMRSLTKHGRSARDDTWLRGWSVVLLRTPRAAPAPMACERQETQEALPSEGTTATAASTATALARRRLRRRLTERA